ncbi:MAG: ArsR family transcriptional regulator [Nanoarchaeota archaeon]
MKLIKEEKGKIFSMNTKKLEFEDFPQLSKKPVQKILELLKAKEYYPKELGKKLKIHEQNIYYYIKKLENAGIIEVKKQEMINGSLASFYGLVSESFHIEIGEFKEAGKLIEKEIDYLKPFILDGKLNAEIIVGSPDPHGPQKARSRDGYFGMDLALFLGSFISFVEESKVKLDTEIKDSELEKNNLIIIGGPIVNRVTGLVNSKMPIYFDEEKKGIHSKISKKTYFADEIGIINKFKNPFNEEKEILLIAGIRNSGTRAAILAFLKHFSKVREKNLHGNKFCKVVEGIDLDSDGRVDDVEFLE